MIYTSGSTGQPKGTSFVHAAIVRLVLNADYVQLKPENRAAQLSNMSFDAATFEIWGPLLNGGSIAVMPRDTVLNPAEFRNALREKKVDVAFVTTALFNQVAREQEDAFEPLKYMLFGGEAVDPQWPRSVLEKAAAAEPAARVWAHGGHYFLNLASD